MADGVAEQFQDIETQAQAARLGIWVFLASELLLFSGLFALYAAYRAEQPEGFAIGVQHNTIVLGSVNTAVLLVSSYTIALAVHELRQEHRRASAWLIATTVFLGLCFLVIKSWEYRSHFREGVYPGGIGSFFAEQRDPGIPIFFTLYFCMTGLHALHVFAGMCVLAWLFFRLRRHSALGPYPLVIGAIYWHLVDVFWIFLWPLFYLAPGVR